MSGDPQALLAIAMMAAITIGLKFFGAYVMRSVPMTPFLERFFNVLPGTLLISLVVPMALSGGLPAIIGCAASVVIVAMRGPVLLAVGVAMAIAIGLRLAGL